MIGVHCDYDGCDTWQRAESATSWFVVASDDRMWHLCSKDHLMLWAANSEPVVVVTQ